VSENVTGEMNTHRKKMEVKPKLEGTNITKWEKPIIPPFFVFLNSPYLARWVTTVMAVNNKHTFLYRHPILSLSYTVFF
jgi:hypothetical protein